MRSTDRFARPVVRAISATSCPATPADRPLAQAGWAVRDHGAHDIAAARGVAVREFPPETGFADFLLYADAKVIGVAEAKPEGHTLTGVETQSEQDTLGLPKGLPSDRLPLPFRGESNGETTRFTNHLDPHPRSREVFAFHRPAELLRLVGLDEQLRARLARMPPLNALGMGPPQVEAVTNLARSLIRMATGSGKTFVAVSFPYRLIEFAGA